MKSAGLIAINWSDENNFIKFESRNTAIRRRTAANMHKIRKYVFDTNDSPCHAGPGGGDLNREVKGVCGKYLCTPYPIS